MRSAPSEQLDTVGDFFSVLDDTIPPNQQEVLLGIPYQRMLVSRTIKGRSRGLDSAADSTRSSATLREVYAAYLYEAADGIRGRIQMQILDKEFAGKADELEAIAESQLGFTRAYVSSWIVIAWNDQLEKLPRFNS